MSEQTPPPSPSIDMDIVPENEEAGESPVTQEMADMASRIAALEEENAQLKNDVLYARADVENLRRRMEQQLTERGKYAIGNFAKDMLSVADNLQRALENVPTDKRDEDAFLDNLAKGVEMTERELMTAFGRYGIVQTSAMNERFDPHLHQAVMEVPNPEVPSGTITMVMQTGYLIHDRLLRPAMVGVAKGGPKPEAAGKSNTSEDEQDNPS